MALVGYVAERVVVRRFGLVTVSARLWMGVAAFDMLMAVELAGAIGLRGMTSDAWLAHFAEPAGLVSLALFLGFGAMPSLARVGSGPHPTSPRVRGVRERPAAPTTIVADQRTTAHRRSAPAPRSRTSSAQTAAIAPHLPPPPPIRLGPTGSLAGTALPDPACRLWHGSRCRSARD